MTTQAQTVQGKALKLQKSLGTRTAAGFLRNRGVNFVEALLMLAPRR